MPEAFMRCVRTKGRKMVTKKLGKGKYVRGCKLPGSKEVIWGEVKQAKR